ncbi:ABC transporter permease [Mesorhizobium escarrei]|uniref:ABC transmembrane type-1 domain-containing protein n=1 Tax=Mesorhizobium escarrei TaxID=666018 RepID=A0ABM9EAE5_9HYPH|nr:ABC transporter permease [Mesorhizobium escarrei]CAH2406142.1 ABC transmembrane type-1 domain-containing protein [Mesorhizobium escarrei]
MVSLSPNSTSDRSPSRVMLALSNGRRFAKTHKSIVVGAIMVGFVVAMAALAPVLSPYSPTRIHPLDRLAGVGSPGYLLGADQQGRDILSRLMWGARSSLAIAVLPLTIAGILGLVLGSVAGYIGKLPETLIMRSMDVVFGLPPILLAIAVAATLGPGLVNLVISLSIVLLPPMTRVTFQVVTTLKEQPFVDAAKVSGATTPQIIFDQIIPNSLAPVIAYGASLAGSMVVFGAGISFIGLGIQPPQADWGRMINDGREVLDLHPHVSTLPGLAIFILAAGFNFLGDGLRDLLDPRMRM